MKLKTIVTALSFVAALAATGCASVPQQPQDEVAAENERPRNYQRRVPSGSY